MGDGTIVSPTKRKRGGYHWKISITGELDHLKLFKNIVISLFNYAPRMYKDQRKKNTYSLLINSKVIYRYLTNVLGLHISAKKTEFDVPQIVGPEFFKHFLAGLFDTDGCVTARAVKINQQSKRFLSQVKMLTHQLFAIEFKGPYLNRKTMWKKHWEIRLGTVKERRRFFQEIPIRIKTSNLERATTSR
jgi:triacylglycerol esterase/lipase EstA (alpha/beta hydrolase family)